MARRTMLIFWAAVAASVFLLGGAFATLRRVIVGGGPGDGVVLAIAIPGLVASLFVAGRIVLVTARLHRQAHRP